MLGRGRLRFRRLRPSTELGVEVLEALERGLRCPCFLHAAVIVNVVKAQGSKREPTDAHVGVAKPVVSPYRRSGAEHENDVLPHRHTLLSDEEHVAQLRLCGGQLAVCTLVVVTPQVDGGCGPTCQEAGSLDERVDRIVHGPVTNERSWPGCDGYDANPLLGAP